MTNEELYAQELKQSEVDHHKPTAGAMTGHIISNLLIFYLKVAQAKFFVKGPATLFLKEFADQWQNYGLSEFNRLNQILTDNGESIPTTTKQFADYSMLEENGADKYLKGEEQLFRLVKDLDTQILFITKAIKLAEKEDWPDLATNLTQLLAWIKEQIAKTQRFLNHEVREGLYNEEDDDF